MHAQAPLTAPAPDTVAPPMAQARWRLVLHGKQAAHPELREQVARLRHEGIDAGVRVTWEPGDAERYAAEAANDRVDLVLAGGGDGTLNEVAGALASLPLPADALPALAVLPLGTANDFATAAGVPDTLEDALRYARAHRHRAVDLVRVDCSDGRRAWFVNVATGGFGSEVTAETSEELKRTFGRVAYLLTGLARFGSLRPAHGRFAAPGFNWEGDFLTLGIGNARLAGGGHALCPEALLDDGLIDVAILPAPEEGALAEVVGKLFRDGRAGLESSTVRARVPALSVSAPDGLTLNLDGEPLQADGFHFEVVPRRLRMPMAPDCPLFG